MYGRVDNICATASNTIKIVPKSAPTKRVAPRYNPIYPIQKSIANQMERQIGQVISRMKNEL